MEHSFDESIIRMFFVYQIVQLVTAACDYEDGTVSPYHSLEELLLLLLPVAEDLKAVERSLLSKRRREESEESASWNKIVRKRTEMERNISGNDCIHMNK